MANIRITENKNCYRVTVDEYPEISFTEKSYKKARDRAVELVKAEIERTAPPKVIEEEKTRVTIGFAA